MKAIIFDAGPLINLSLNGLLYILEDLKKTFDGKFLITNEVKYEVVDRPLDIQRFELGALKVQNLIDTKILELPGSIGISNDLLSREAKSFASLANHFVQFRGNWLNIVSSAEMSCLALSSELTKREIGNIIAIDERTTRILCENPGNMEEILEEKLHENIEIIKKSKLLESFGNFKFIRSTEIVYVAYKKGLIKIKSPKLLEALLYATKYKGSSVSWDEINELKRM